MLFYLSVIVKLVPALLLALRTAERSTLASSSSINNPTDLSQQFRQLYRDLEEPGPISRLVAPTLRFSFVSPPKLNISSDGRNQTTTTTTWRNSYKKNDDAVGGDDDTKMAMDQPNSGKGIIAVYLPGLDGYGVSAALNQFDDMATAFELWRLTVLPEDRSSFVEVVEAISKFVKDICDEPTRDGKKKEVILIGESCGGLLAAAVAVRLRNSDKIPALKGLVLVNPATSFDQTPWSTLVPLLTSLQYFDIGETTLGEKDSENRVDKKTGLSLYSVVGSLLLSALVPDSEQQKRILDTVVALPSLQSLNPDEIRGLLDAMADAFRGTEERLPPRVLEHRVTKWLSAGTAAVNARLSQIHVPTLVVVGREDRLMPSLKEAERLVKVMPNAEKLVVRGRGHFVLDGTVNLTEAILYSRIDPLDWKNKKRRYDPILDWQLPSRSEFAQVVEASVNQLRIAHSPAFFSTDDRGKRWMGLSKVRRPTTEPLLFVGNHQFGTFLCLPCHFWTPMCLIGCSRCCFNVMLTMD
jgi:pimeloyl-ACP methyl ester carboxylesterase